jgi:DNA-binding transcriptional LysR family regulator
MTILAFGASTDNLHDEPQHLPLAQPGLEIDLLKTLVAIAETGSFQRAAKAVYRTPSAVSMQMKRLEDLIGRHVFVREGRGVTLTVDGAELLGYARRILALADEALLKFRQATTEGRVRLGTPDDYAAGFLPSILARFAKTHPNVQVDVTCHPSYALVKLIDDNDLDIALVDVGCSGASAHAVYRERLVWAGHRDGSAYRKRPLPLAVSFPSCGWRKHAIETLTRAGVEHRVAYSSHQYLGQLAAVQADLAVAPLSLSTITGDLVMIEDKDLPPLGHFEIDLKQSTSAKGPAVDALIHHIKQSFDQRAAALAA